MHAADFVILAALGAWLILALRSARRRKGGCGGCGSCSGCSRSCRERRSRTGGASKSGTRYFF